MNYKKIGIIFAMKEEAGPLLDLLHLKRVESPGPYEIYRGLLKDKEIIISLNGKCTKNNVDRIGTVPAALNVQHLISSFPLDLMINAGTAGGFKKKSRIGDVYLSTEVIYFHDRRISLPGFQEFAKGGSPSINTEKMTQDLQLKRGQITSGDSFDNNEEDLRVMQDLQTDAKEMEAASIAYVCEQNKVPFLAVKSITDFIDSNDCSKEEFLRNLSHASKRLQDSLLKILESF